MEEKQETAQGTVAPKLNLYQRLAKVQGELPILEKKGKINFGNTKYGFVTAEDLFTMLRKRMADAGIVVIPMIESVTASPGGDKNIMARMVFRIVNADDGADYFDATWYSQAPAMDDKGCSKCGTSGLKYFLMRMFMLSDGEDPDYETQDMRDEAEAKRERKATTNLRSLPASGAEPSIGELRAEIETLLSKDDDARERLPKSPADMNSEECVKTISWLSRRARALTEAGAG